MYLLGRKDDELLLRFPFHVSLDTLDSAAVGLNEVGPLLLRHPGHVEGSSHVNVATTHDEEETDTGGRRKLSGVLCDCECVVVSCMSVY